MDSLKVLDPEGPIREVDMLAFCISGHDTIAPELDEENAFSQSRRGHPLLVYV